MAQARIALRTMLRHPTLGGAIVLVIHGLVEYILSWGSLWRPVALGAGTFLLLFVLNRLLLSSDEPPTPSKETRDVRDDEGPSQAPQPLQASPQSGPKTFSIKNINRKFSPRTAQELVLFMKGWKKRQRKEGFVNHYAGKWLSVEGEVHQITAPFLELMTVYLHLPHPDPECSSPLTIDCMFNAKQWLDELVRYSKGDGATIIGKIRDLEYDTIKLGDCELVQKETAG